MRGSRTRLGTNERVLWIDRSAVKLSCQATRMARRPRIPSHLIGMALPIGELPDHGVPRTRAVRGELSRPYHGVRGFALDSTATLARCRAVEPMLHDGVVFSHSTALELHGAPALGVGHGLHMSVAFPRTPPRGAGVVGHSLQRIDPTMVHGLPVSEAATAWCQAASLLSLVELVAAADSLLTGQRVRGTRQPGAVLMEQLEETVESWPRSPGVRKLRWALAQARVGVDSVQETRTRLVLVSRGLPEPAVDVAVDVGDELTFHSDMGYPEARIAIEYEGDEHRRSRSRWLSDVDRHERMREAGWAVVRVTAPMLADPHDLVARIRRALSLNRAKTHL